MFRESTRDAHNIFEMARNAQNSEGIPERPAPSFLRTAGHLSRKDNYRGGLKRLHDGDLFFHFTNPPFRLFLNMTDKTNTSQSMISCSAGPRIVPTTSAFPASDRTLRLFLDDGRNPFLLSPSSPLRFSGRLCSIVVNTSHIDGG